MFEKNMEDISGVKTVLPPVINPNYKSTPNCAVMECVSFYIACAKKISPGVMKHKIA